MWASEPNKAVSRAAFHVWPGPGLSLGARGQNEVALGATRLLLVALWPPGRMNCGRGCHEAKTKWPKLHSAGPAAKGWRWKRTGEGRRRGWARSWIAEVATASKVSQDLVARRLPENHGKRLKAQGEALP